MPPHASARPVPRLLTRTLSCLNPAYPPGESKNKDSRYLDLHEHDPLDEAQFASWVKQAHCPANDCERPRYESTDGREGLEAEWGDPKAAGVARVLTIGESFMRRVVLSADNGLR